MGWLEAQLQKAKTDAKTKRSGRQHLAAPIFRHINVGIISLRAE